MSRRRSRLSPAISSGREFTVDDFLKGLARAPRTHRGKRRFVDSTSVLEAESTLIETLTAIENDEAKQDDSAKQLKSIQGVDSEDREWDILVGNTNGPAVSKKPRRKHYVVYNSLPLARVYDPIPLVQELSNNQPQFSHSGPRDLVSDPIITKIYEGNHHISDIPAKDCGAKPHIPVSVIRNLIMGRKGYDLTRVSNNTNAIASQVKTRNRPGSGFYCTNESLILQLRAVEGSNSQISAGKGVLGMADSPNFSLERETLPLSLVSEVICDWPRLKTAGTLGDKPQWKKKTSKPPGGAWEPIDSRKITEKPLSAHFRTFYLATKAKIPEVVPSKIMDDTISVGWSSLEPEKLELQAPPHGYQEICKNEDAIRVSVGIVTDEKEANQGSQGGSQVPSINQTAKLFLKGPEQISVLPDGNLAADGKLEGAITPKNVGTGVVEGSRSIGISVLCKIKGVKMDEYPLVLGVSPAQSLIGTHSETLAPISGLGRVGLTIGGQTLVLNKPLKRSLELVDDLGRAGLDLERRRVPTYQFHQNGKKLLINEDEQEEEPTSVSRRLFLRDSPGGSYFSVAQRALKKSLDNGVKISPQGYLRHPTTATHRLPIVNEDIGEGRQSVRGDEDLAIVGKIPSNIYNLNCTEFSTPIRTPSVPVALKDLLDRTSKRRRPSISGIFRSKPPDFPNSKQKIQGQGLERVIFGKAAELGKELKSASPPIVSGPRNIYA